MTSTNFAWLSTVFNWLLARDKQRHHWRRYILGATASVIGFIGLGCFYMVLMPKTYTSEWTAILPGAGVESRVSLDRIGQAQSSSNSPFSDKALSPKVNYKEIAESRPVLEMAAKSLGIEARQLGEPKIRLIDQTSIMQFQIKARTPEDAQRRGEAIFAALKGKLDELRDDEIKWRNVAIRNSLNDVEANLKIARDKLLQLQITSGLSSVDQYNQLVASIENLRREQANTRAQVAEKQRHVQQLSVELGIAPRDAGRALALSADPEFRKLRDAYSLASAQFAENAARLGPQHPLVVDPHARMKSVSRLMKAAAGNRLSNTVILQSSGLQRLDNERFLSLLSDLVNKHSELAGLEARLTEIESVLTEQEKRRDTLSVIAARLDDLQRDHLVANAVFSSAVARIDATRSDIYASYPLIQLLEPPTLPEKPSSPRLLYAIAGVVVGSLLSILGWTFAWLHQWFAFARLRRRLSSMPSA